ncbi:MAG TPA: site-2 protease family protein [Vicinamibacterales bacterium]|nr:site-2 protease family protein [Vicinamibacterales bacterium]
MRGSISLGRIAGIPIRLHYSWLIIAALITLSLAAHFRETNPAWGPGVIWPSAVVTALLFFATLLAHELSHALVARSRGLPVRSITLFALGGIAQIEKDAGSAKTEFWMGIAGPIASLVIGFACISIASAAGWTIEGGGAGPPAAILGWLGSINVVLALFNLIPGYPLDGGRVLRAILWGVSGDADRATRQAAAAGQAVAIILILIGLLQFFGGAGFGGLWLAFIGWFLLDAARAGYADVALTAALRGVRAGDVMARDCDTVAGNTALDAFADLLLRTGRRCFIVTGVSGEVLGLITPQDVRRVDRSRWPTSHVKDAMRPLQSLKTVTPATPVTDALATMSREDVNQLPVLDDGRLVGIVTRTHVLRLIQTRAELNR